MQVFERRFEAIAEAEPGALWQAYAAARWPHYEHWFRSFDGPGRPTWLASFARLREFMPELVPLYEALLALGGGGDRLARFLTLWCPPAYMAGCSQAAWMGASPVLMRNYDYNPALFEAVLLRSEWEGVPVMASADCLWGVLDGLNGDGLAVSLAFGGSTAVGEGFGIPLVLRYILQTCATVAEGVAVLKRVPVHMSYNVLLVDRAGHFATVQVAPDRDTVTTQKFASTNHQDEVRWWRHALATQSVERAQILDARLPACTSEEQALQLFLHPPLYSTAYARGFGTLYTAVWRPAEGAVDLIWPDAIWRQSLASFEPGTRDLRFVSHVPPRVRL